MKSSKRKLYSIYHAQLDQSVNTVRKKLPDLLRDCKTKSDKRFTAASVMLNGMYRETEDMRHLLSSINAVQMIQEAIQQKASPTGHWRSFHYRQLMHERYYQGEYKDWKPGSRIVFVRESFVGEEVTPETLVEA